jgi:CBS domain-containing protein
MECVPHLLFSSCDVFTISEHLPALFALAALHKHNRPAAALVSSTKQLVGAISMSDVRGLTPKEVRVPVP